MQKCVLSLFFMPAVRARKTAGRSHGGSLSWLVGSGNAAEDT